YAAIGPRATSAMVPTTGFARFKGDAIGAATDVVSGERMRTIGDATVDIDFAGSQVRGDLVGTMLPFDGSASSGRVLNATFFGSLDSTRTYVATQIESADVTTGVVQGELYGADARGVSELGGVWAL